MSHEDTLEIGGRKIKAEEKDENGEEIGQDKRNGNKKREGRKKMLKQRYIKKNGEKKMRSQNK